MIPRMPTPRSAGFSRPGPPASAGWSRCLLMSALLMSALLLPALPAADAPTEKSKAINTICPVTGKPIDGKLSPVVVVIGKGEKAKRYSIGIAVASAADSIKGDPQKYADAAKANRKAE